MLHITMISHIVCVNYIPAKAVIVQFDRKHEYYSTLRYSFATGVALIKQAKQDSILHNERGV